MTEGFFSDPADEPGGKTISFDISQVEYGQQTGLTKAAALDLLRPYVSDLAAVQAIEQAETASDGIVIVDGITVSFAKGHGYAVIHPAWRAHDPVPAGPLTRDQAADCLARLGYDADLIRVALQSAEVVAGELRRGGWFYLLNHKITCMNGTWHVLATSSSADPHLARLLTEIRDIARDPLAADALAGSRIRTLLYPAHIHDDDGTVEGCPGCFPPAEVIPDPAADARKASMAAFEEAARYWPDLSGEYNVLEILVALRLVDAALDAFAPDVYQGADPASRLLNRWRRIAAGPASEGQEAVDALNLATGGNPRKGVVGDDDTILGELGDGVVANLLAIQHMTKDTDATWSVFIEALAKAVARVPVPRPAQDAEVAQWGTCQACARSGVGACDDFPDCPNGRPQQ